MVTKLCPLIEVTTPALVPRLKAVLELMDPTIERWGMILRDPAVFAAVEKALHPNIFERLFVIGYKSTREDFTEARWARFFAFPYEPADCWFWDHETALGDEKLGLRRPCTGRELEPYLDCLRALSMGLGVEPMHYPGISRDTRPDRAKQYFGLAFAAAGAGALVVNQSLGYASRAWADGRWVANQNAVSLCADAAVRGAWGSDRISRLIYADVAGVPFWPIEALPIVEADVDAGVEGPACVHLGWGKTGEPQLEDRAAEWVRVFDAK